MTTSAHHSDAITKARHIDEVCDRFEAAWKAYATGGPRPSLADYLTATDPEIIHELLPIEAHYLDRYLPQQTPLTPVHQDTTLPFVADAVPTLPPAPPGFQLLGVLARGGMGIVYRATQPLLQREVAFKVMRDGALASPEQRTRFLTEAETLAAINHPSIVQIYQYGVVAGSPYLALELCTGGSLAQRLAQRPLDPVAASTLVERLALAVQVAHEHNIIHRDLKPSNILLTHDGQPKITDFGLAHRDDGPALTVTGDVLGTPAYMAPEQAAGQKVNASVDVYALGAILYECLAGRPPFVGESPGHILQQVLHDEPTPLARLLPRLPNELATIVQRCLEKEPRARYVSAAAVAADLRAFLEGRPIAAKRITSVERLWKWTKRKPWLAGLTAGLVVTLLAGSGFASYFAVKANRRASDATDAKNDALTQATEARAAAVRMYQDRGYLSYRAGDGPEGLLWNAHALANLSPDNTAKRTELTRQAQAWLGYAVPLVQVVPYPGAISAVALSADGSRMAIGGDANNVVIVATATGTTLTTVALPSPPLAVRFTTDAQRLLTTCADHGADVWEVATGQRVLPTVALPGSPTEILVHPSGTACLVVGLGTPPTTIQLADGQATPYVLKTTTRPNLRSASLSADGKTIAFGSSAGMVLYHEWGTGKMTQAPATSKETDPIRALALVTDSGQVMASDWLGGVSLRGANGLTSWRSFSHIGHVRQLARTKFGQVVCASETGDCHIFEPNGMPWPFPLACRSAVNSVAVDAAGQFVLTGSDDGYARIWRMRPQAWHETVWPVDTQAASYQHGRILLSTAKGTFCPDEPDHIVPTRLVNANALSPDGTRVFVVEADKTARLWERRTGQPLGPPVPCPFFPQQALFSPDGSCVLAWGFRTGIICCDGRTGAQWQIVDPPNSVTGIPKVLHVAFSTDSQTLYVCGSDDRLHRWRITPGQIVQDEPSGTGTTITALQLAVHEQRVALAFSNNEVRLYDRLGVPQGPAMRQAHNIVTMAFQPQGTSLFTAGEGGLIYHWDVATQRLVGRPWGNQVGRINRLVVAPQGPLVATIDSGSTLRFWDVTTGQQLGPPLKHTLNLTQAQFTPTGDAVYTLANRNARLIPVPKATPFNAERLRLWVAVHFGLEVNDQQQGVQLTTAPWYDRWQQWQQMGGTLHD